MRKLDFPIFTARSISIEFDAYAWALNFGLMIRKICGWCLVAREKVNFYYNFPKKFSKKTQNSRSVSRERKQRNLASWVFCEGSFKKGFSENPLKPGNLLFFPFSDEKFKWKSQCCFTSHDCFNYCLRLIYQHICFNELML